jgi:predicted dehydrogenase
MGFGLSRKDFLLGSAGAAAAPTIIPAGVLGSGAPSNTLNVAIVGCGGRSRTHIRDFSSIPGVRVVAVCDIWDKRAQEAKASVDAANGDTQCRTYKDFREMIAHPEVDIVTVAAPDHWHALVAIEAANRGKHIYLDKPFAYSIEEGRAIINAVKRNGVILQHGTQQRSMSTFQRPTYLARHGFLGNVDTAYAISPVGHIGGDPTPAEPPQDFDFDFFTGPAPKIPFFTEMAIRKGTPGWYFMRPFCSGWLTAWGSHHVDSAQFAMGKDHEAPVSIEASGLYPETGAFDAAYSWYAEFKYADGKKMIYCTSDRPECPKVGGNVVMLGDRGWAAATRGQLLTHPANLLETAWPLDDPALQLMDRGGQREHFVNFIDAIRYGVRQNGPMEVGHLSTSLCHLAGISIETQRSLVWDAKTETIVNDPQANRLLGRSMRAPWKLG